MAVLNQPNSFTTIIRQSLPARLVENIKNQRLHRHSLRVQAIANGSSNQAITLKGIYLRDNDLSDMSSYERSLDMMQLSGLPKITAMQLIEGLELLPKGDNVAVKFLTGRPSILALL